MVSLAPNPGVGRTGLHPKQLGESPFLSSPRLQQAAGIPWVRSPSSIFKAHQPLSSDQALTLTLCFPHHVLFPFPSSCLPLLRPFLFFVFVFYFNFF